MDIQLKYNYGYAWFCENGIYVKGQAFDAQNNLLSKKSLTEHFANIDTPESFREALWALNGIFSVVIVARNNVFAAVDRQRNFPLFVCLQSRVYCHQ